MSFGASAITGAIKRQVTASAQRKLVDTYRIPLKRHFIYLLRCETAYFFDSEVGFPLIILQGACSVTKHASFRLESDVASLEV